MKCLQCRTNQAVPGWDLCPGCDEDLQRQRQEEDEGRRQQEEAYHTAHGQACARQHEEWVSEQRAKQEEGLEALGRPLHLMPRFGISAEQVQEAIRRKDRKR